MENTEKTQVIQDTENGNGISISFADLILQDREKNGHKKFEGAFLDYLHIVEKNPKIAMLAHARLYKVITSPGIKELTAEENPKLKKINGNKKIMSYKFFEDDFFGMENVIMQVVRYYHSAAHKGEESRQVLLLIGPVGAGKSSLIEKIKSGLEQAEPMYALKGCPMREEPLHLIPKHLRAQFEKLLGLKIEGDLCPICKHRLTEEYENKYENFPVIQIGFSKRGRVGVGAVPPVDPNNQDTSVLIGSEDISKLDLYPENDPRVLSLNGAFNAGNRGVVEFIEVFKNETEFLHTMITATQEKSIPSPGKHSMIYFDGVILAHSNEAEWNKFKADHTNEAILDRIVKIEVPYVLRLSEEVKIYEKMIKNSNFTAHIAPHTLETVAMFTILTRLMPSECDLLTKLKIYNGEDIVEKGQTKKISVSELQEKAKNEGMCGISTRFGMKCLDNALSDSEHQCINPISIREAIIQKIKEQTLSEEIRKSYLELLQKTIHEETLKIFEKEISKAFVHSYREQADTLFKSYIDHAEAFITKKKLTDLNTKEELDPDLKFLESIEEQMGIKSLSDATNFRNDVISYLFSLMRVRQPYDYKSYEPLKEAIEKKLLGSVRDLCQIITKAKTRDKEQTEKYDVMVKTMIKEYGYCEHCCEVVLRYAANHLWKKD